MGDSGLPDNEGPKDVLKERPEFCADNNKTADFSHMADKSAVEPATTFEMFWELFGTKIIIAGILLFVIIVLKIIF